MRNLEDSSCSKSSRSKARKFPWRSSSRSNATTRNGTMAVLLAGTLVLSGVAIGRGSEQCSFAFTGKTLDGCDTDLLGHRQEFYDRFFEGCVKRFSKRDCLDEEMDRYENNQYQSMGLINMTSTGFMKIKAPDSLRKLLTHFWETNQHREEKEDWDEGEATTNHWEAPTYMVSVGDDSLPGSGDRLKKAIWNTGKTRKDPIETVRVLVLRVL